MKRKILNKIGSNIYLITINIFFEFFYSLFFLEVTESNDRFYTFIRASLSLFTLLKNFIIDFEMLIISINFNKK